MRNAQALDGIFIAARRDVVDALGGFNEEWDDFLRTTSTFRFERSCEGFASALRPISSFFTIPTLADSPARSCSGGLRRSSGLLTFSTGGICPSDSNDAHPLRVLPAVSKAHAYDLYWTLTPEPWPRS